MLNALLISGLIVTGAFGLAYLAAHGVIADDQREISTRSFNFTAALILVWWSNLAPKRLRPLVEMSGDPAKEQSVRRLAGRAIVIGGVLSALAWVIAPFKLALPIEASAIGGALIIVFLRPFFSRTWHRLS
jgi:hypothetical protein